MKEDLFENKIKESLNGFEPEVPEALWENIRQQIPTSHVPADGGSQVGSMLKWAAPAAAVVGGALALWYFSGTPEVPQQSIVQDVVPQSEVTAPEKRVEAATPDQTESSTSMKIIEEKLVPSKPERSPDVQEVLPKEVVLSEDISETEESQLETAVAEHSGSDEEIVKELTEQEPVVKNEDFTETVAHENLEEDHDDHAFELVEVGILADRVTGEAPLTVQFRNVTKARSFEWDFGNGKKSYDPEPTMTFSEEGDFNVRLVITDFDGMVLQDEMEINVFASSTLFYPQAFTPNGDGINDFFELEGTNVHNVRFTIQRPDGSVVFEGHGMHARWDGSDTMMPEGRNYMVVIHYVRNNGEPAQEVSKLLVIRDQ
ncbi:MAG: PKD domain-containing protein [Cryomorphaceae bacterium]|nr:MAG: PKD domain-containing protein [Cryomorphaceae bacterium]